MEGLEKKKTIMIKNTVMGLLSHKGAGKARRGGKRGLNTGPIKKVGPLKSEKKTYSKEKKRNVPSQELPQGKEVKNIGERRRRGGTTGVVWAT